MGEKSSKSKNKDVEKDDDNIESVEVVDDASTDEQEDSKDSSEQAEDLQDPAEPQDETQNDTKNDSEVEAPAAVQSNDAQPGKLKRFFQGYWQRKKWTLPLTVLVLAGLILAIPQTRYPVLALGLKREAAVFVIDAGTNKEVASAKVTIDGQEVQTNNHGAAIAKVRVGKRAVTVSKKYYNSASGEVFVNAFVQPSEPLTIKIKATGRQVPVMVFNKLTGKAVENATVKAAGTEAKTDKIGEAILVVPADKAKIPVEISFDGFNKTTAEMVVSETAVPENGFRITPSGKVYFLSKKSGKIDVVKTNLDGTDRQTVVAGTGQEDEENTTMLASRDWHYLALLSRRDSKLAKLYLIDTTNDKMTVMDEGDAGFALTGWNGNTFVYTVDRNNVKISQPGHVALKTYDAKANKLSVIDQSEVAGGAPNYATQQFTSIYLFDDRIVYGVSWSGDYNTLGGKSVAIRTVSPNGQNKKDLKTFPADKYFLNGGRLYKPREAYFAFSNNSSAGNATEEFYEYEAGVVKPLKLDSATFYRKAYPTYLLSPSGKRVFWSEERDGQDTFFTGNLDVEDTKQLRTLDDYKVYGWYSDDYVVVSKKSSELYIMPVEGTDKAPVTKITDYHKPVTSYVGYGGGYGGL